MNAILSTGRRRRQIGALVALGALAVGLACNLPVAQGPTQTPAPTEAEGAVSEPDLAPTEAAPAGEERLADTVYYNGSVVTMEAAQPVAQAIALAGDRILAVGSDQEVLALSGASAQVIDLRGSTVMPGFIDTHSHRLAQRSKWGFSTFEQAAHEILSQGWTGVHEQALEEGEFNTEVMHFDS